ncbi:hypothetical protein TrLO_g12695 [Triparma laevis f. longispina]|nr:hypothetical protein TrLO_g12695 [Triparma laevis f. longispina]
MKDYTQLYGNNYSPIDPTPSYFNSSEEYLVAVHFAIAIVGSLGSLFIIYILWGKWSNGTHRGTFILALSDFLVNISFYHVAYQAALHHRVPSRHICLIEGFTNHALCTLEFSCLVMIAVDRLAALRAISDGKKAMKKSFRVLFLVWAGCFLHAAMPLISDYGYYDIAPSGYHCYGHGGKGVASHDVFTVTNVVYFLVCFAILIYQFWHSNKIIKRLAEPSLNEKELLESGKAGTLRGRRSKEKKRLKLIKFHKESLLLSVVLVTGFLAAWGTLALHFSILPFVDTYSWGRGFFWVASIIAYLNHGFNWAIHFYLNKDLRREARNKMRWMWGKKRSRRGTGGQGSTRSSVGSQATSSRRHRSTRSSAAMSKVTRVSNVVWRGRMAFNSSVSVLSDDAKDELLAEKAEDAEMLEEVIASVKEPQFLSAEEQVSIDEGIKRHRAFSRSRRKVKTLKQFKIVKMFVFAKKRQIHLRGGQGGPKGGKKSPPVVNGRRLIERERCAERNAGVDVEEGISGRLQCNVKAHPHEIIAFMMARDCERFLYLDKVRESTNIDFKIVGGTNAHNKIMSFSFPHKRDRILFVCETVWTQFESRNDKWVLTMTPDYFTVVEEEEKDGHAVTRGGLFVTMNLHLKTDGSTQLDTVFNVVLDDGHVDVKPNRIYGLAVREFGTRLVSYFQKIRGDSNSVTCDEKDGRACGELICSEYLARRDDLNSIIATAMWEYAMLRKMNRPEIMQEILRGVLENQLSLAKPCKSGYDELTISEAREIGKGLSSSLIVALSGDAGVDEWIRKYHALIELNEEAVWFSSMLHVIARRLMSIVPWGTQLRVYSGAFISVFDTITDVWVGFEYIRLNDSSSATFIFVCILVSFALQCFFVYLQNIKLGFKKIVFEIIPVIFGVKSILDAYRVSSGKKAERLQRFDYMQELAFSRCSEAFGESIPSLTFQIYLLLLSHSTTTLPILFSIFASSVSASFALSALSYDLDVDPNNRANNNRRYGYIPNTSLRRLGIFVSMFCSSICTILVRTFSLGMLLKISKMGAIIYVVVDLCIFLIFKYLRNDLLYFLQGASYFSSVLERTMAKVVSDYTGMFHLRNTAELGGLYYLLGQVQGQVVVHVILSFYFREEGVKEGYESYWRFGVLGLNVMWLVSFLSIVLVMEKDYRQSLFTLETGRSSIVLSFLEAKTDHARSDIFTSNPPLWNSIRPDVKNWMLENYVKFESEHPEW